jgi:hypothetical protein
MFAQESMARDTAPHKKTKVIQVLFSPDELQAVDSWRFENFIGSRGEAIRQLIARALTTAPKDN